MTNIAFWLILAITLSLCPVKEDTFSKPYSINIIDEHEVQFIHDTDTVIMYFENATVLAEEYVVFIEHKSGLKEFQRCMDILNYEYTDSECETCWKLINK